MVDTAEIMGRPQEGFRVGPLQQRKGAVPMEIDMA